MISRSGKVVQILLFVTTFLHAKNTDNGDIRSTIEALKPVEEITKFGFKITVPRKYYH